LVRRPDRRDGGQRARQARDATQQPQHLEEAGTWLRSAEATVDVRGMRADEALAAVDRHLDSAVLAGHPGACIVHGLGTGALRDAVRQHLRRHPQVSNWRAGQGGEGGDGATLVWLRD
jgi:DNA mismatch repair protein MutS2